MGQTITQQLINLAPYIFGIFVIFVVIAFLQSPRMARLSPKRIMNKSEERLFHTLCKTVQTELGAEHYVFTQVSYGELIYTKHRGAFRKYNAKRADFVISGPDFFAIAVVEYQGSGHFGHSNLDKRRAEARDTVKRKVLKRAGIPLIEVSAKYDQRELQEQIASLAKAS